MIGTEADHTLLCLEFVLLLWIEAHFTFGIDFWVFVGQKDYSRVTVTLPSSPKSVSALSRVHTGLLRQCRKRIFLPVFSFCSTGFSTINIYYNLCLINDLKLVYFYCLILECIEILCSHANMPYWSEGTVKRDHSFWVIFHLSSKPVYKHMVWFPVHTLCLTQTNAFYWNSKWNKSGTWDKCIIVSCWKLITSDLAWERHVPSFNFPTTCMMELKPLMKAR